MCKYTYSFLLPPRLTRPARVRGSLGPGAAGCLAWTGRAFDLELGGSDSMALLVDKRTQRSVIVEPELLVGRSSACGLRISQPYVSARHAAVRWDGDAWEVKDLGSRNGTFLNGTRLSLGQSHRLQRGAELGFGNDTEIWELRDDAAPRIMAIPLDGGEPVVAEHDVIGLPSSTDPQVMIFRDTDMFWKLETSGGELMNLEPQRTFNAGGRVWRFSCPEVMGATTTIGTTKSGPNLRLELLVSKNEEHVELIVVQGQRVVELGSRNHNYLLVMLARARREDSANGVADSGCGWMYQDDLVTALRTTSAQLNIDVFRIRQHFAKAGLGDVVSIIERRPSTKQLRIGVGSLEIRTM